MQFMLIVKATRETEAGKLPTRDMIEAMGKFNQEMVDAGVFVTATGLKSSACGARVNFSGSSRSVTDGPFAETKEVISGFWLIDVPSKEDAIAWARRSPNPYGPDGEGHIEVRQVFGPDDFAEVMSE